MRAKAFLAIGLVVAVTGAGAIVAVRRAPDALAVGSLRVTPAALAFPADDTERALAIRNEGPSAETLSLETVDAWLAPSRSQATIPAGGETEIVVRVARLGLAAGTTSGSITLATPRARQTLPVTVHVDEQPNASGPARLEAPASIDLGSAADRGDAMLLNLGGEPLTWRVETSTAWLSVQPDEGTIAPGGTAKLRVRADRASLEPGARAATIAVTSNGGDATIEVGLQVERVPLLQVVDRTLDFGLERTGTKTLPLRIRNRGHAPLEFRVSVDKDYVSVADGGAGTVAPGEDATVAVTYDYDKAYDGPRRVELIVTSNGGSGTVVVTGVTDSTGPFARDRRMVEKHEHCDGDRCELYRHAFALITDETSEIVSVRLEWQLCSGVPGGQVTCSEERSVPMRRGDGDIFFAEVGPLPGCTPGVGSYIPWQIYSRDSLGNRAISPGSSTHDITPHCAAGG